jgi:uncharacterized RDD family membrane protein YckC
MRRPGRDSELPDEEPQLFDLPLSAPSPRRELPLSPAPAAAPKPVREVPVAKPRAPEPQVEMVEEMESPEPDSGLAPVRHRLAAGGADLLVHAALAVVLVAGSWALGVRPQWDDLPPFALFVGVFSFLYCLVPLAFWGQTLGMVWAGLVARNRSGEPLTFDQSAWRWLGMLLTVVTAGLPLLALLLAGRRSLTDRISGSATLIDD